MTRAKTHSLVLPITPRRPDESKQNWIYRSIRESIEDGALHPLARLPSTRDLATSWCVSRGVVELAYDQLSIEGYTESQRSFGTRVAASKPDVFGRTPDTSPTPPFLASESTGPGTHDLSGDSYRQPFVARTADPALFPVERWRRIMADRLRRIDVQALVADDPAGYRPLRDEIAKYLGIARGIRCSPDSIIVVTGIRHAIDLASRLLRPGDQVLIEDPGYPPAYEMFESQSLDVIPVPLDAEGISLSHLKASRHPALVYLTPSHQSPLGVVLSASRRKDILDWAEDRDVWILEDDYDSEINYHRAPLMALKGTDTCDRVIHCGSFNKTLFPALRIGYMVVPDRLREKLLHLRALTGRANGSLDQIGVAAFLQLHMFESHIRTTRNIYRRRRDAVVNALADELGPALRLSGEDAGFHFVLWLPPGVTEHSVRDGARAAGIRLQCVGDFCKSAVVQQGVLIGYAAGSEHELAKAATRLGTLIREQSRGVRQPSTSASSASASR